MSRRFLVQIVAAVLLIGLGWCASESCAQQPQAAAGHKVLAFYYTWYGNPEVSGKWYHWRQGESDFSLLDKKGLPIVEATNHPAIGLYDSNDPLVIAGHLKLAHDAGIDAFIATWWGQGDFTDKAFKTALDVADKMKSATKLTVYYETVPGNDPAKAVSDLQYILNNYGARESFLKVSSVPVIFLYGRAMGQLRPEQWTNVIAAVKKDGRAIFIADTDGNPRLRKADFDGFHIYNPVGRIKEDKKMDEFYRTYVTQYRAPGNIVCLTVIPGYDDTHVRQPGLAVPRAKAQLYGSLWFVAVAAQPDWILVTSWNEWHEGSEIEPSVEDGRLYLDLTKGPATSFKGR